MKEKVRTISAKAALFIKAIWLLSRKVIKQLILPNRSRKGNILSSILLLFVSLTELLTNFSMEIPLDFIARWKHYERLHRLFKKAVLITGCLLFLLSSFEWSYKAPLPLIETGAAANVELQPATTATKQLVAYRSFPIKNAPGKWRKEIASKSLRPGRNSDFITSKIYLRNCDFRV